MNVLSLALFGIMASPVDLPTSFKELVTQHLNSTEFRHGRVWSKGSEESGFTAFGEGRRESDRAAMSVDLGRSRSTTAAERHWQAMGPSLVYTNSYAPFSELPLGSSTRRHAGAGSATVETYDGLVNVRVQIKYRGTGPRGQVTWHAANREGDKRMTEAMARKLLAAASGLTARPASGTALSGASIPTVLGVRGERLVDLARYCQVLGIALNMNSEAGSASFTHGGELVIVPLAAKKLKDGSQWIESTDISIARDGTWYVSFAALQAARS